MRTYFIAAEGLPYQEGKYPDIIPTMSFTDRFKEVLEIKRIKTIPAEDGYVETHFKCKEFGNSVIKHLP